MIPSLMGGGIMGHLTGGLPPASSARIGTGRSDELRRPKRRCQQQTAPP